MHITKGNTDKNCAKAKRQLKAGECFVKYIEDTLSRIGQSLDKEVKYRSVLLLDPKSNKKVTKGEKREYDKDGYIKLCQGTVQLNMLVKYPLAE